MKYLIGTDDSKFYMWQVLVQINNFRKLGIEEDAYYVIAIKGERPSPELVKLINDPTIKCNIEVYQDDRKGFKYSSTLRLRAIRKFVENNSWFEEEVFMYIDPDVIFTRKFDWTPFEKGPEWYVSDTRSYIDSKYIKSKSSVLFEEMCSIVDIEPTLVEANDDAAGGAQYIMKNVPLSFWDKVEMDSEKLFVHMKNTESVYHPEHPIQSWTADMWAVLWNGLLRTRIKIIPEMDFCWASDKLEKWNKCIIFHDAGVVKEEGVAFCKVTHQISPFNKVLKVSETSASLMYVNEIKETEQNFPNLIF